MGSEKGQGNRPATELLNMHWDKEEEARTQDSTNLKGSAILGSYPKPNHDSSAFAVKALQCGEKSNHYRDFGHCSNRELLHSLNAHAAMEVMKLTTTTATSTTLLNTIVIAIALQPFRLLPLYTITIFHVWLVLN